MIALITAVSGLIASVAFLLAVIFLHRMAKPLAFALRRSSSKAAVKRLSRLSKLADEGCRLLSEPDPKEPR
jgi:hypothetical protein